VLLLAVLVALQFLKIREGAIGNKTENTTRMFWFFLIAIVCCLLFTYFLLLQPYVLLIEFVINAIGLLLAVLEIVLGVITMGSFKGYEKNM